MADSRNSELSGAERAAILLMSLGEQDAAAILKHMDPRDVEAVGSAMAALAAVPKERAEVVVQSFLTKVETGGAFRARELAVATIGHRPSPTPS